MLPLQDSSHFVLNSSRVVARAWTTRKTPRFAHGSVIIKKPGVIHVIWRSLLGLRADCVSQATLLGWWQVRSRSPRGRDYDGKIQAWPPVHSIAKGARSGFATRSIEIL